MRAWTNQMKNIDMIPMEYGKQHFLTEIKKIFEILKKEKAMDDIGTAVRTLPAEVLQRLKIGLLGIKIKRIVKKYNNKSVKVR